MLKTGQNQKNGLMEGPLDSKVEGCLSLRDFLICSNSSILLDFIMWCIFTAEGKKAFQQDAYQTLAHCTRLSSHQCQHQWVVGRGRGSQQVSSVFHQMSLARGDPCTVKSHVQKGLGLG